jgi:hypothetical protein
MELARVRSEFEAGRLREAVIEPSPTGNGWLVLFREADGELVKLTDHVGADVLYHDLDSATKLANDIGFATIRVEERF